MSHEEHFRKLERMYLSAPTNVYYNPGIKIWSGNAEVTLEVKTDYFHAASAVHGSVYFKLLDDAAYFSINSLVIESMLLTVSFSLQFFRPVLQGQLRAVGTVLQHGRRISSAESVLYDSRGRVCAKGSGSFMRSDVQLTPEIGYK